MASGGLLAKYQQLYQRMEGHWQDWCDLQERAEGTLTTCAAIILRLPAMQDPKNYGTLAHLGDIQDRLLGKQLQSFEQLLDRLQGITSEMGSIVAAVGKLAQEGDRLLRGQRPALSLAARTLRLGATPSLAECVRGLQDIWGMLRDELALKRALLEELTYEVNAEDLQTLQRLFMAQPNVEQARIKDLFHLMAAAPKL